MANTFNISDITTKEALVQFQYNAPMCMNVKNYNKWFKGMQTDIEHVGLSINVKKPNRFVGETNGLSGDLSVQDITYDRTPLAIEYYSKAHTAIGTLDESTKVGDFKNDIAKPLAEAVVDEKERLHSQIIKDVGNVVLAGTGGTDVYDFGRAKTIMKENGTPMSRAKAIMSQSMMENISNGIAGFYQPQKAVEDAFYKGEIMRAKGFDFMDSEYLPILTLGTANDGSYADGLTPLGDVAVTVSEGTNTVQLSGISVDGTIKAGTPVQFANTYAVHAKTYETTGRLKTFSVAEDVTTSTGTATITLTEKIYASGSLQNVTALPAATDVVSFVGKVSTPYKQGICMIDDTFLQAFVKLVKPKSTDFTMMENKGVIVRSLETYESGTAGSTYADNNILRVDSVSGIAGGRLEMGCRILEEITNSPIA